MVGREGSRCSTSFLVSSHGIKFYLKFQKSFILLTFLRVCHRVSFPAPSRPIPFEWTCILAVFLNGPLPGRGALAALLRDRGRLGPGTGDPLPTLLCDVAQHLLGAPAEAAPLLGQGGGQGQPVNVDAVLEGDSVRKRSKRGPTKGNQRKPLPFRCFFPPAFESTRDGQPVHISKHNNRRYLFTTPNLTDPHKERQSPPPPAATTPELRDRWERAFAQWLEARPPASVRAAGDPRGSPECQG